MHLCLLELLHLSIATELARDHGPAAEETAAAKAAKNTKAAKLFLVLLLLLLPLAGYDSTLTAPLLRVAYLRCY
jgi:hypothetical protein